MKKIFKMLTLMLFAGALIVCFASCANDSSSGSPAMYAEPVTYSDGLYEYDDKYTQMYLYYEGRSVKYAGNKDNEYPAGQLEVLKTSHNWNNVSKYCTKVNNIFTCKWLCKKFSAQKLFKAGWYSFTISSPDEIYEGYFESIDSPMTYTICYAENDSCRYRTKTIDNNKNYSSSTWKELFDVWMDSKYAHASFISDRLAYYGDYENREQIELSCTNFTISKGEEKSASCTLINTDDDDCRQVFWESSDSEVVELLDPRYGIVKGKTVRFKGLKEGTAYITCRHYVREQRIKVTVTGVTSQVE